MATKLISGGCLCGEVRYEAGQSPHNITHCHCSDCRRASGAPFVTWATFDADNFRFVHGEPRQIDWAGRVRSFCQNCGTALTFRSGPDAREIDVTVCSFEDATSVLPRDHTWVEDRLAWIHLADGLPEYPQRRSDPEDKSSQL
ncbi:MAG: hypothetical protein QOG67_2154 [Verrucomicrobiota bacterium]|jgi:hypothetical protein